MTVHLSIWPSSAYWMVVTPWLFFGNTTGALGVDFRNGDAVPCDSRLTFLLLPGVLKSASFFLTR